MVGSPGQTETCNHLTLACLSGPLHALESLPGHDHIPNADQSDRFIASFGKDLRFAVQT